MSKNNQDKAARKAAKAARKAAKQAAELQAAAPASNPPLAGRVDEFMVRHAPSKTDMRWYHFEIVLVALASGIVALAHTGGLM